MQYTTLHDIKRVITSFENSINKASNKVYKLTIGQYPHISLDKARDITTEYNAILQSLEFKEKGLSLKDYLQYMQDKDKNAKLTFNHVFTEWIQKQSIRETTKKAIHGF